MVVERWSKDYKLQLIHYFDLSLTSKGLRERSPARKEIHFNIAIYFCNILLTIWLFLRFWNCSDSVVICCFSDLLYFYPHNTKQYKWKIDLLVQQQKRFSFIIAFAKTFFQRCKCLKMSFWTTSLRNKGEKSPLWLYY